MGLGEGVVTEADVRAAQAILDELNQLGGETYTGDEWNATARGALARWAADVRTAGYLEGYQVGARFVAGTVRDALDGEGL